MRIAVLFGGTSEERDVSVASGSEAVQALEAAGHEVIAVDTVRGLLGPAEREQLFSTGVAPTQPSDERLSLVRHDTPGVLARTSELRHVDANNGSNNVMLLRPSDGAVLATVPVGRSPFGVTVSISLSGINVWVASFGTDTVSIIDPKQLR